VSDDLWFFEADALRPLARDNKESYRAAAPFPHHVFDGFLPDALARKMADEFPPIGFSGFRLNESRYQWKKQSSAQESDFAGMSPLLRHLLNELNGKVFLDFLERLTGIEGLIPDPHFNGGGIHQILPGGSLAIHRDGLRDIRRKLDRRVNVILYLNHDWREEWGGHLELWDNRVSRCEVRLAPTFNRCVIFHTTPDAYHGHPDPLRCPEGRSRNSLALYYFTNGRPEEERVSSLDAEWKPRPGERFPDRLTTLVRRGLHFLARGRR